MSISTTRCNNCNKSPNNLQPGLSKEHQVGLLKACGRCRKVSYCSKTCQKKDWKLHKLDCLIPKGSVSSQGRAKEGKGQGIKITKNEESINLLGLQPYDPTVHHPASLGSYSSTSVYDPHPASYSNPTTEKAEAIAYKIIFPNMGLITPAPLSLEFMSVPLNDCYLTTYSEPGATINQQQIIEGFSSSIPEAVKRQIYSYLEGVGKEHSRYASTACVKGFAKCIKVSGQETAPSLVIFDLETIEVRNRNRECEKHNFEVRGDKLEITDK